MWSALSMPLCWIGINVTKRYVRFVCLDYVQGGHLWSIDSLAPHPAGLDKPFQALVEASHARLAPAMSRLNPSASTGLRTCTSNPASRARSRSRLRAYPVSATR